MQLTPEHVKMLKWLTARAGSVWPHHHPTVYVNIDEDIGYRDQRTKVVLRAAPGCNDTALAEDMALLDRWFANAVEAYYF